MRRRKKFNKKNRLNALTEINVTPLIDLAFALLIIFMIATPLLEQTIPINLPIESAKQQAETEPKVKIISIDKNGKFYLGNKAVSDLEMNLLLQEFSMLEDIPVLRIRADRHLEYNRVIELIDLIKQNNLVKISLDTELK